MNVLSLFDGISCGQEALKRAGIKVDNYFASEIDKHAIKIAMKNYPNTIQLGDVTKINSKDLPKIDMLIGGSPCQGFSFAGKQLNFNDDRSKLFFEYVRLNNELQPKWFLLENVPMKKQYERVITNQLKIAPVEINSKLVSAQNRKRLYWTNIPVRGLPTDKNIMFNKYLFCRGHGYVDSSFKHYAKMPGLCAQNPANKYLIYDTKICVKDILDEKSDLNKYIIKNIEKLKVVSKDKNTGNLLGFFNKNSQSLRVYYPSGKGIALKAIAGGMGGKMGIYYINGVFRKLTPIECERLQTLPDNYTEGITDNQRYKCLGNGWTVEVISWIFSFINKKHKSIF